MQFESILIVDDSATSRMIIKRCFEIAGYLECSYYEAEDGMMAISFLENNRVDLIVTDLRMPKMDGTTFIKKLKVYDFSRNIPIIVVSSIKSEPLTIQLLEEGVMGIIKKPISPEKVILITGERENET